ncbi:hypothetical protein J3R30DRAFT_3508426 [Lentinula aciculospora]|uniref:Uncharacterized protein n=1 Tax=Lentinula aciculospora TaxID=153920 RepID=A0A9W9A625_9AGAR|nr:hypothetical protein J3R30DRAFT_3508426 [Lentinula aciculospora]
MRLCFFIYIVFLQARRTIVCNNMSDIVQLAVDSTGDSCDDINHCRTLLQILWSCISVLISCTWVSVHPNLPGPEESPRSILGRKIGLMLMTLIAPEIMVLWASRQWFVARKLSEEFKNKGWTKTHAYFALMGGFALYEEKEFVCVMRYRDKDQRSERELKSHADSIGLTSEEEIQDRSHSDGLSKLLAVGQTSWFVIQLLARRSQRLSIAELEIMTIAYAVMNVLIYFFWWNKPLGIRFPIHIQTTRVQSDSKESSVQNTPTSPKSSHREVNKLTMLWLAIRGDIMNAIAWIRILISRGWGLLDVDFDSAGLTLKMFLCATFIFLPIPLIFLRFIYNMIVLEENWDDHLSERIASFERVVILEPSWRGDKITAYGAAVTFGAIHCAAWAFIFPTPVEQTLWKIFSLIVTCVPILLILTDTFQLEFPRWYYFGYILSMGLALLVLLYTLSRFALIIQAFVTLRSLPSSSFQTIDWVTFLPHI